MIETHTSFDGEYDGASVEIYKILTDMIKKKLLKEEVWDPEEEFEW